MSTPRVAAALSQAPFKVGQKQVYLPNFSITLHRASHLGPKYATFTVPLWFSKLDLRDYLFHAYNVRTLGIRSYVKLQRVVQGKPSYLKDDYEAPQYKRWHRPKSIKRMTVELDTPFVWPDPPADRTDWQEEYSDAQSKLQKEMDEMRGQDRDTKVDKPHFNSIREQAQALLEGREKWRPAQTTRPGPVLSR